MARADLASYAQLPWRPEVARLACDIYVDDKPHPYCSRVNLRRVLAELRKEGYIFNCGMEPEHFLVQKNPDGSISMWDPSRVDDLEKPCYDFKGLSQAMDYLQDLTEQLNKLHWGVYQCDHEDGNGQYEVNFRYTEALTTADRYTFFKMATSQIARKYGCIATHMAKPFANQTGSGAHFHFHLADAKTGENLFTDPNDRRRLGMSRLAYHFIGGIFRHARALCAVASPTVNCYKRLQIGAALTGSRSGFTWTPAFITYGDNNRTQMIRTPGPGRFEDRTISAACNPYLALAAFITAGMDGVRNEIDPGEPNYGQNMYDLGLKEIERRGVKILPQSLYEALAELKADSVIQGSLGPIFDEFLRLKEAEWRQYHRVVSQWEIDRYLQLF
jgi:glutamine synthetase